jgi:hypothetical protein
MDVGTREPAGAVGSSAGGAGRSSRGEKTGSDYADGDHDTQEGRAMKRRLPILLATAALGAGAALGVAACGDDDETTTETTVEEVLTEELVPAQTTTAESTTEETTTEETTTESGDDSGGSSGLGY